MSQADLLIPVSLALDPDTVSWLRGADYPPPVYLAPHAAEDGYQRLLAAAGRP